MNRLAACLCLGLIAAILPPHSGEPKVAGQDPNKPEAKPAPVADEIRPGTVIADFDMDGFLDVVVANGTDRTVGRGIAVGDFDLDGRPDLFVVGDLPLHRIYRNLGNGLFEEVASPGQVVETIRIDGGKVEITDTSIKVEGGKVEIVRRRK